MAASPDPGLQQEPKRPHEINRVLGMLAAVARAARQLDVAVAVLATKRQRDNVIDFELLQSHAADGASTALQPEQSGDVILRVTGRAGHLRSPGCGPRLVDILRSKIRALVPRFGQARIPHPPRPPALRNGLLVGGLIGGHSQPYLLAVAAVVAARFFDPAAWSVSAQCAPSGKDFVAAPVVRCLLASTNAGDALRLESVARPLVAVEGGREALAARA